MKTCILVLGMHRSGTSALTGLVHKAFEVFIGDNLLGNSKFNPKGHFENNDLLAFNEKILRELSSSWDDIFFDETTLTNELITEKALILKQILNNIYKEKKYFIIKEPRISLLFPIYEKAFKSLNIDLKIIHMYRNPIEVSMSLYKRANFFLEKGLFLWGIYISQICHYTKDKEILLVDFHELVYEEEQVLHKIANHLNLAIKKHPNNFIEKSLKHHSVEQNAKLKLEKILLKVYDKLKQNDKTLGLQEIKNFIQFKQKEAHSIFKKEVYHLRRLLYERTEMNEQLLSLNNRLSREIETVYLKDLKNAKSIAVFGKAKSGQLVINFLEEYYSGKIQLVIDDRSEDIGYKIVTTQKFLKSYQESTDLVVFGAFQNVPEFFLENIKVKYLRLNNLY